MLTTLHGTLTPHLSPRTRTPRPTMPRIERVNGLPVIAPGQTCQNPDRRMCPWALGCKYHTRYDVHRDRFTR